MKMHKLLLLAAGIGLMTFFVSCNKDQGAVRKLEGTWNITQVKVNGTAEDISNYSGSMTFDNCKLKSEGSCPGTTTFTLSEEIFGVATVITATSELNYLVSGDGSVLTATTVSTATNTTLGGVSLGVDNTSCTSNCTTDYTIIELKKDMLIMEYVDDNGDVNEITCEKAE